MRIVAGVWRGRALIAPAGQATRPTADRVRQALFDMLLHAPWGGRDVVEGARVLDAFAGTGAHRVVDPERVNCALSLLSIRDRGLMSAGSHNENSGSSGGLRVGCCCGSDVGECGAATDGGCDLAYAKSQVYLHCLHYELHLRRLGE